MAKKKVKKWIPKDLKKGQLHRDLGVSEAKKLTAKDLKRAIEMGGKVAKRARLAQTLRKFSRK